MIYNVSLEIKKKQKIGLTKMLKDIGIPGKKNGNVS